MDDKVVQRININYGVMTEFSLDELENILKVAKEIEKASPVDIDLAKGTIEVDGQHKESDSNKGN
jgi:glycerol-3-phosphate responsive antiterminator